MSTQVITTTETAKAIRHILKNKFAGVKFTVRSSSFAGGNAVDIKWIDGPTEKKIESAIKNIGGVRFITCKREYSIEFTTKMTALESKSMGLEMPKIDSNGVIISDHQSLAMRVYDRMKSTSV